MFRKFEAKFFSKLNVDKMLIFSGRWEKDGGWGVNVSRRRCISGNNHIVNVFVPPKVVRFDLLFAMYSSTKAKEKDEKKTRMAEKEIGAEPQLDSKVLASHLAPPTSSHISGPL